MSILCFIFIDNIETKKSRIFSKQSSLKEKYDIIAENKFIVK